MAKSGSQSAPRMMNAYHHAGDDQRPCRQGRKSHASARGGVESEGEGEGEGVGVGEGEGEGEGEGGGRPRPSVTCNVL